MATVSETRFAQAIRKEVKAAQEGGGKVSSLHEAHSLILEKLEALWSIAKLRRESREPTGMAKALVQIAAECERCCSDLGITNELPACNSDAA